MPGDCFRKLYDKWQASKSPVSVFFGKSTRQGCGFYRLTRLLINFFLKLSQQDLGKTTALGHQLIYISLQTIALASVSFERSKSRVSSLRNILTICVFDKKV